MDEKKKQKLINIARIADKGMVGLLEYIADLEMKLDETSKLADKLEEIKSKSDNKIINSINLTDEDKKDISNIVKSLVKNEDIAELIHDSVAEFIKQDIEDSIFSRVDSKLNKAEIIKELKASIPQVKDGKTPTKAELNALIKPLVPKISQASILKELRTDVEDTIASLLPDFDAITKDIQENLVKDIPQFTKQFKEALEKAEEEDKLDTSAIKGWAKTEGGIIDRAISIVDNRTSFLINKVSNLSEKVNGIVDEKAIWGSISGTITDQTDLVDYIADQLETQDTLQEVTENGATTTVESTFSGGLITNQVKANGSGGLLLEANNGTDVALLGAGGGAGSTFYGGVNMNTTATVGTSLTTPLVIGGTGTTDDLILQTTSGVGATGADMIFKGGNNGATEFMRILNSGNVGIGSTAPAVKTVINNQAGTEYAQVGATSVWDIALGISANASRISGMDFKNFNALGQVRLMARSDDDGYIVVNAPGSSVSTSFLGQTGSSGHFIFTTGATSGAQRNLVIGTLNPKDVIFGTNNATNMTLKSGGNLGIGTTNPSGLLEVSASGAVSEIITTSYGNSNSQAPVFTGRKARGTQASPTAVQADDFLFFLGGRGYNGSAFPSSSQGAIVIKANQNFTSSNNGTYITFETTPNNSATRSERLRITDSGNVGIGTTNPLTTLHVAGPNVNIDSLFLSMAFTPTGGFARFAYWDPASTNNKVAFGAGWGDATRFGIHIKSSGNFSATTERFSVLNNGNVGIGTTAPASLFHVDGVSGTPSTANALMTLRDSTSNVAFQIGGTDDYGWIRAVKPNVSNSHLTRGIIKLGNDFLSLGDGANENQFYLDTTNERVGIGTTTPLVRFHNSDGTAIASAFTSPLSTSNALMTRSGGISASSILVASNTNTDRGVNYLIRARGTTASPTAVVSGDHVGDFLFGGYDGTALQNTAGLFAFVDGTVSSGVVPMRLSFVTGATNSATRAERLVVKSNGNIGIGAASPTQKLTIKKDATASEYSPIDGIDAAIGITTNDGTVTGLDFHNQNSSGQVRFMARSNDGEYIVMNAPGSTATGAWFGANRNNTHFIWTTRGASAKNMAIGPLGNTNLILGTNDLERMRITGGGNVGIGGTPDANAILDVQSTTKAFLPPRMTTAQRDAISSPVAGMVIYNTTTNVLNFYNGSAWGAV
jgi:hypothetical protein